MAILLQTWTKVLLFIPRSQASWLVALTMVSCKFGDLALRPLIFVQCKIKSQSEIFDEAKMITYRLRHRFDQEYQLLSGEGFWWLIVHDFILCSSTGSSKGTPAPGNSIHLLLPPLLTTICTERCRNEVSKRSPNIAYVPGKMCHLTSKNRFRIKIGFTCAMQHVLLENKVAVFYSTWILWYDYRLQLHLSGNAADTFTCFAYAASIAESRHACRPLCIVALKKQQHHTFNMQQRSHVPMNQTKNFGGSAYIKVI